MIYEINKQGKEELNTKDMVKVISYLIMSNEENKIERLENAIYNTYTINDAKEICQKLSQAFEVMA